MKILFIAEGSLGDLLTLTPAVRMVKKSFPDSFVTVLIVQRRFYEQNSSFNQKIINLNPQNGTAEVYTNNPNADEVVEVNRGLLRKLNPLKRLLAEFKILKYIRKKNFDTVICTQADDRYYRWAFISGAKRRIGENKQRFDFLLTNKVNIKKSDKGIINYFCKLAEETGAISNLYKTEFFTSKAAKDWAIKFISENNLSGQKLIAIHPGSSSAEDIWPPENFAALINKINLIENTKVILCGTDFDRDIIKEIKTHLNDNVQEINFGNNLQKFAAILEHCKLSVSNDSGPRHLSIACAIPSLAFMMFSKRNAWKLYNENENIIILPENFNCNYCSDGTCLEKIPEGDKYGAICIRSVTVNDAFAKVQLILNK